MKRIITIAMLTALAFQSLVAQDVLPAFAAKDPKTMAMGGSFLAVSTGYQSLFGNPASFADKKVSLTVLSVNPWVFIRPTSENVQAYSDAFESGDFISALSDVITENGFGLGAAAGMGWVGKGLGLGFSLGTEAYINGPNVLGAKGSLETQAAGVVGIALPLELFGLRLSVGGDLRPYLRMTGAIGSKELFSLIPMGGDTEATPEEAIMDLPADVGFGIALDLGAKLSLGDFATVGLVVRDMAPGQNFSRTTYGEIISGGTIPEPDGSSRYVVYPNITIGASIDPIPLALRPLVDTTISAEIQDPIGVISDGDTLWNLFHIGAEARFLRMISLRAGVNKGWLSFGAGLKLLILDVNVALFSEELGPRPGDMQRSGVSLEAAIRF